MPCSTMSRAASSASCCRRSDESHGEDRRRPLIACFISEEGLTGTAARPRRGRERRAARLKPCPPRAPASGRCRTSRRCCSSVPSPAIKPVVGIDAVLDDARRPFGSRSAVPAERFAHEPDPHRQRRPCRPARCRRAAGIASNPTHAAPTRLALKPTNHVSRPSFVVPVLPARSLRPSCCAREYPCRASRRLSACRDRVTRSAAR